jgi:hypothetical protein
MTESTRNDGCVHLTFLSMQVESPVEDPDEIADLGDDDNPALTLTDLR